MGFIDPLADLVVAVAVAIAVPVERDDLSLIPDDIRHEIYQQPQLKHGRCPKS